MIASYEGVEDKPPKNAVEDAEKYMEKTGHTCVLARGKFFFQKA